MSNRLTLDKNGIIDNYNYNNNKQLTELAETVIEVSGIINGDSTATIFVEGILANTEYIGNNQLEFKVYNIWMRRRDI